mgnify:CR=1 FL=1
MEPLIKNLPHARPFPLKDQVGYEPGKVVSLTPGPAAWCGDDAVRL